MHKRNVYFRADGNGEIGLGHLYRCLALAQMLQEEFHCTFVSREIPHQLLPEIEAVCTYIQVTAQTELNILQSVPTTGSIIVLDGYQFDEHYRSAIKTDTTFLVSINDFVKQDHVSDVIINHGIKDRDAYAGKIKRTARSFTGFRYLVTRPVFLERARLKKEPAEITTLFICIGGADPFNLTIKSVEAAIAAGFLEKITVVTGAAYTKLNELNALVSSSANNVHISHLHNLPANQIADSIANAQLALCPSSTIALEAACIKTGLITGYAIDNQQAIHDQLVAENCCLSIGDFNHATTGVITQALIRMNSKTLLKEITDAQQRTFDGFSGNRILEIFKSIHEQS